MYNVRAPTILTRGILVSPVYFTAYTLRRSRFNFRNPPALVSTTVLGRRYTIRVLPLSVRVTAFTAPQSSFAGC